jgi:hypothetical protein
MDLETRKIGRAMSDLVRAKYLKKREFYSMQTKSCTLSFLVGFGVH